jgi:hypothetical protein
VVVPHWLDAAIVVVKTYMNLTIEKELKCTILVCMICYLRAIIRNSYAMKTDYSFMRVGDWAEEIKEILKRKRVLARKHRKWSE